MPRDPALDEDVTPAELSKDEWRSLLDPVEFRILRESGTERPGTGRYLDEESEGAYHCAGCGTKLYDASHKFHSGCGWPSFFQEVEPDAIRTIVDSSHGMTRTEMRCAGCDGHLGHIFPDAPQTPTGMRHCVNGNALILVPTREAVLDVLRAHRAR